MTYKERKKIESKAWWKGFGLASLFAIIIFRDSVINTVGRILAAIYL